MPKAILRHPKTSSNGLPDGGWWYACEKHWDDEHNRFEFSCTLDIAKAKPFDTIPEAEEYIQQFVDNGFLSKSFQTFTIH